MIAVRRGAEMTPDNSKGFFDKFPGGVWAPERDVTFDAQGKLAMSGRKMRLDYDDKVWSVDAGKLVPRSYWGTFDGKRGAHCFPIDGRQPRGVLHRRSEKDSPDWGDVQLGPMIMAARTCGPKSRYFDVDRITVVRTERLGRTECVVLQQIAEADLEKKLVFVENKPPYRVMRYLAENDGVVQTQIDNNYSDTFDSTFPVSWTILIADQRGAQRRIVNGVLTGLALDATIDPKRFAPTFAVGTLVFDAEDNTNFIQRENRNERRVTPNELIHAEYSDLLVTEEGEALAYARRWSAWQIGGLILGLAAVVGLVIVWWRRNDE